MMDTKMSAQLTISVVGVNGEKLFNFKGLLFDQLDADPFDGGKLTVLRGGEVYDETSRICEQGTHAACTCFVGLPNLLSGYGIASTLSADKFLVGDILHFDVPQVFDYGNYLRQMAAYLPALAHVLRENPEGMSLGELGEKLPDSLAEEWDRTKNATILRFRSNW